MDAVEAAFRTAVGLQKRGDLRGAVDGYRVVLDLQPHLTIARNNLCLALLALGDYERGFALYDVRFERGIGRVPKPSPPFPEWQGQPLAGRSIVVFPEQGFGDQIMFARFILDLVKRGADVSMAVPDKLRRLFSHLPVRLLGLTAVHRHDFWIMAGSIPGRIGVTMSNLSSSPYLLGDKGNGGIGVAWRGDPRHHNDAQRSLPAVVAAELLCLPDAISLDPADTGAKDFADTAAIIRELKIVVAVDTAVAHLSGAMGKPTFVMLPAENTDWRWMRERSDSPWYATIRLFRQPAPGDWKSVVSGVKGALEVV